MVKFDWTQIKKYGDSMMVRIPMKMFKNPEFPFEEEEEIIAEIKGNEVVLRKP